MRVPKWLFQIFAAREAREIRETGRQVSIKILCSQMEAAALEKDTLRLGELYSKLRKVTHG